MHPYPLYRLHLRQRMIPACVLPQQDRIMPSATTTRTANSTCGLLAIQQSPRTHEHYLRDITKYKILFNQVGIFVQNITVIAYLL